MTEEIVWSEWYYIPKMPNVGDLVELDSTIKVKKIFGTKTIDKRMIVYVTKIASNGRAFVIEGSPQHEAPIGYIGNSVYRWRRRLIGDITEAEQEGEVEA